MICFMYSKIYRSAPSSKCHHSQAVDVSSAEASGTKEYCRQYPTHKATSGVNWPIKDQAPAGLLALADGYLDAWPTIYPVNTAHSAIPTPLAFQWLVAQQE